MLYFCNVCSNSLIIDTAVTGNLRFSCVTCPYIYDIGETIQHKSFMRMKDIDEVIGGDDAWDNVDKLETTCPKCSYHEAYYRMMQTRSADEPMTTFYKCVSCAANWRD